MITNGQGQWWRDRSKCFELTAQDPSLASAWIDDAHPRRNTARLVCRTKCLVRFDCLTEALSDRAAYGLRGGFFFENGAVTKADAKDMIKEFGVRPSVRNRNRRGRSQWQSPGVQSAVASC